MGHVGTSPPGPNCWARMLRSVIPGSLLPFATARPGSQVVPYRGWRRDVGLAESNRLQPSDRTAILQSGSPPFWQATPVVDGERGLTPNRRPATATP